MMEDPMSAAVAWDVATAPVRVPNRPARPVRPQLVSVPCGDEVVAAPTAPLRVTRAGRLAITLTLVVAVVAIAVAVLSGGASATVIDHSTTVQTGQTLSEIAAKQLPQLSVADAVAQIQVANDLTSTNVHAGQSLLIPRVG
jgi:LysM repeat protein